MAEVTRTTTVTTSTTPAGIVTTTTVTDVFTTPIPEIELSTVTTTNVETTTVDVAQGGAAKSKKEKKKEAKKEAKKEKKEKKEAKKEEAASSNVDPKAAKAATKEGGKKGQDLAGMADMGGIKFFHVVMEQCDGNFDLLELAMQAANVEVDEKAEDRKGGASNLGKMFFSASVQQLAIYVNVPESVKELLTLQEWVAAVNEAVGGEVLEQSDNYCKIVAKLDESKERFPLKLRDAGVNAGFALLRSKQLVMDEDSDDDIDYEAMQDAAGIEW